MHILKNEKKTLSITLARKKRKTRKSNEIKKLEFEIHLPVVKRFGIIDYMIAVTIF